MIYGMDYFFNLKQYHLTMNQLTQFYGADDHNIKYIEKAFQQPIQGNGDYLIVQSKDEMGYMKIKKAIELVINKVKENADIDKMLLDSIIKQVIENKFFNDGDIKFVTTYQKKVIKPKNESQVKYFHDLEKNTIIFATGAAGTGKTFLAVAYAIDQLKKNKTQKIIITRPIVEAGENLGFLPGELKEKVDPYLTPIYDALNTILGVEMTQKYLEKGIVEIAPLAYMRGRTLSDAIVILDEAQNTTAVQMKMFLTRLGYNAKMIITGDESQIDLKNAATSGLIHAKRILQNIEQIAFITFQSKDVVRNPLVGKIIDAYETKK